MNFQAQILQNQPIQTRFLHPSTKICKVTPNVDEVKIIKVPRVTKECEDDMSSVSSSSIIIKGEPVSTMYDHHLNINKDKKKMPRTLHSNIKIKK